MKKIIFGTVIAISSCLAADDARPIPEPMFPKTEGIVLAHPSKVFLTSSAIIVEYCGQTYAAQAIYAGPAGVYVLKDELTKISAEEIPPP